MSSNQGANTAESSDGQHKNDLELKRANSSTKKQGGKNYNQVSSADQTIDDADEDDVGDIGAVPVEEDITVGGEPEKGEDDDDYGDYDDDIDAELDNLEQSVKGDDEDDDTDEDDGKGQPDFAPYDHSLKKKVGAGQRTEGLGVHPSMKARSQLLTSDSAGDYDGVQNFDT